MFAAALSGAPARRFFAAHAQSCLGSGAEAIALSLLAYERFENAWANRRTVGVPIIALGGLCNFTAITANGGVMPTAPGAAGSLAGTKAGDEFANSRVLDDAKLQFLGDVFATPTSLPLHNVFSVGDLILMIGVIVLVHGACGSRIMPRRFRARAAIA